MKSRVGRPIDPGDDENAATGQPSGTVPERTRNRRRHQRPPQAGKGNHLPYRDMRRLGKGAGWRRPCWPGFGWRLGESYEVSGIPKRLGGRSVRRWSVAQRPSRLEGIAPAPALVRSRHIWIRICPTHCHWNPLWQLAARCAWAITPSEGVTSLTHRRLNHMTRRKRSSWVSFACRWFQAANVLRQWIRD